MKSRPYTLTKGAEADLDEIYQRSMAQFAPVQTRHFFGKLKQAAEFAAAHVDKVPARRYLTGDSGLYLYPIGNFYIAYRPIAKNHIVIISVFHQSRDILALIVAESAQFQKDFAEIEHKILLGKLSMGKKPKSAKRKRS